MPGVLIVREAGSERRVALEEKAVVGRDSDCEVVLKGRSVSRKHAVLERTTGGWVVRDLGSANGLFVEGKRVSEAPLVTGAALRFGDVPATFESAGSARSSSAERLAQSLSVAPAKRSRPVAVVVILFLGVAALVAATIWTRSCDRAAPPRASATAPVSPG